MAAAPAEGSTARDVARRAVTFLRDAQSTDDDDEFEDDSDDTEDDEDDDKTEQEDEKI